MLQNFPSFLKFFKTSRGISHCRQRNLARIALDFLGETIHGLVTVFLAALSPVTGGCHNCVHNFRFEKKMVVCKTDLDLDLRGVEREAAQSVFEVTIREILAMFFECFNHKPLLRKKCSCGPPPFPPYIPFDSTRCQTVPTQRSNG